MKYIKFPIVTLVALLSIQINSAYASELPRKCPSVNALKQVSFIVANGHPGSWWTVGAAFQKYDTKEDNWDFYFFLNRAKDRNDALQQANDALKTLTLTRGPIYYDQHAGCDYSVANPAIGDAEARCYYEICYEKK